MTSEQYTALEAHIPTPEEEPILRFLKECNVRNQPTPVFYAWGLVDEALLDTPIPQSALDQVYGEGVVTELTLRNFCLSHEPAREEGKVLFSLSANYNVSPLSPSRDRYTGLGDGVQWFGFTEAFGVTPENAIDSSQLKDYRPQPESI